MKTRPTPPKSWKPGQSGNPKGRAPGTSEAQKIRASIATRIPEILNRLIDQALEGDTQAARLLLERTLPPMKAIEQPVAIQLPEGGMLTAKADAILTAAATGLLTPGQASQLITALGTVARITEIDDLTARITKLEAQHGNT